MNPVLTMYKLAGVKNLVLWNEDAVFPKTVRDGVISFGEYQGIQVTNITVPSGPSDADIASLVSQIKHINPDGVIGATYVQRCAPMIKALRSADYFPKAFAQIDCVSDPSTPSTLPDAIYGLDKTEYDHRMTGLMWTDDFWYPPTPTTTSAELVYQDSIRISGVAPHWSSPVTAAAGLVLHKVLERTGTRDTETVRAAIGLFNEPSFIGQIGFSSWGQNNVKDVIVLQEDQNFNLQIVYPLGSATANLIYPAPTFDERVMSMKYMAQISEQVLAGIAGFFILISLGLLVFVVVYFNHSVLRAATPLFLIAILFGSILLYGAYYTWLLEARTALCHIRFWMIGLGFVIMFGALFSKTWRIMRIFTMSDLKVFQITNLNLFIILSLIVGFEIALLSIWSATSNPVAVVKVIDPLRPARNIFVCQGGPSGKPMLGLLVAYKLAMVLSGIYMSIRVWKIPLKQFNESRPIAFSMYNMLCFGILAFALQVSGSIADPTMFIIRSIILIISTFFTVIAIFVPKIIHIYTGHTGRTSETMSTNKTGTGSRTVGTHSKSRAPVNSSSYDSHGLDSVKQERSVAALEEELDKYKRKYYDLKKRVKNGKVKSSSKSDHDSSSSDA